MLLKVAKREGESVIDADDRGRVGAETCHKPFSDLAARPIPAGAFWGSDLAGSCEPVTRIYAQTFQAGCRHLSARVVNADVTVEGYRSRIGHSKQVYTTGWETFTNNRVARLYEKSQMARSILS
jgi:hypothetical protein